LEMRDIAHSFDLLRRATAAGFGECHLCLAPDILNDK
jgi:hypothetical protein